MPTKTPIILALDPGDNTGFVLYSTLGKRPISIRTFTAAKMVDWLLNVLYEDWLPCEIIICEDYIRRVRSTGFSRELAPRICGAVEIVARFKNAELVWQQPASIKTLISDDDIRSLGWKWSTPHERDALKHLHLFLSTRK